jgi:anti-sigma factor RsiW
VIGERMGEDERAEAYLEGELSRDDAAAFERDLAGRPEVADALGATIMLRDLLGRMPPLQPPPGLEQRIVGALHLGGRGERAGKPRAGRSDPPSAAPTFRAALNGASWLFRPPAAVMQGGMGSARPLAAGLSQLRWVLGPLATTRPEPDPRPALWRRAIGTLGKLGGLR